jgi:hypothetical protein
MPSLPLGKRLLKELLKKWATDEFRSKNGQLVYLLHQALLKSGRLPGGRHDKDG